MQIGTNSGFKKTKDRIQHRGRSPDLPDDSTVATWNIRSN
jgi:hypothetical protein